MQDRAMYWQSCSTTSARRIPPAEPTHRPYTTAALLAAGTLAAAGTFAWMLPASSQAPTSIRLEAPTAGVHDPVPPPAALTAAAPAAPSGVASPSAPLLPRALLSLAFTTAERMLAFDAATAPVAMPTPPLAALPTTPSSVASVRPAPTVSAPPAPVAELRGRRVVYLVDASGSLLDSLPQVIEWLGESLDGLDKRHQFTVLFFRRGQVIEAPPTGMKPASFAAKASVWTWMQPDHGNVVAEGRSDLSAALRAAAEYRADEVVILSDDAFGKHRASAADGEVIEEITGVVGGRSMRVHTVQFFYRDEAGALEAIADCFDGSYTFVPAPTRDVAATGDPLLDLAL